MSPDLSPQGVVLSADALNQQIRALWMDPRVRLTPELRAEYMRLVAAWEQARRAEIVTAA